MTPERFRQIEELYHAACEGTAEERAVLLAETDPELRREIESLLAHRTGGEFLESPAIQNTTQLLDNSNVDLLAPGACLGPYRIESKLGEGGMGQVFRAVDTRLGRAIAVKITREQFSAWFEREARAISALNHPNICTLHDVGPNYLVMELVEGETLAARLKNGSLPIQTALLYGSQITAALVEAHGKGITHRDLKPGNIMLGKSGVKVLDFGLARSGQNETATERRMIIGTPAYMAPEQRESKPADARTDIYALGCVLYEMLTGARVEPQLKRIRPRKLEQIVKRCLQEDPGRRWQSAAELQRELAAVTLPTRGTRLAVGAAVILALCTAGYFYLHRATKLTTKDTIVLAEFENKTSDPVFDQTLRQGLAVQLEQSPFLSLVSDQRIQQVLRLMKRPPEARLTPDVAREICERTGSDAVLEGSIAGLGSQFVLWLRVRNCRTGEVLAEEQAQPARKEEVLNALSRMAVQIRTRLGESMATIHEHSTALEQATTSSLEALKAYSAGRNAGFAHGFAAAIPHLQRAIAIDPQFAMAYGDLSIFCWNTGQTDLAAEYTRKAYGLRDRVSDRERLWILFLYDRQVTGNLQRELQTLETWVQTYPRDWLPLSVLGGWGTMGTGQYERGIKALQEDLRLNPDDSFAYGGLALHNIFLDRFGEAADALRRAAERKLEIQDFLVLRYHLAFFKGDQAGMEREIARARGQHGAEDWMWHNQALVLARSGQMRQARTMWDRAAALAQQAGNRERAAIYRSAEAVCEAHFGNAAEAKRRAAAALDLARGRDVEYSAAFALALSGESSASQRLAEDLEKRFPEDTPVQFEYLPTLRALSALTHGAPLDAVEHLERARPYDLALPGTAFFAKFGGLYPAYIRGKSYLAAGHGQEAAVEFQKVLDHRGIVFADPIGALAHLQLGRACVASGDKAKAKNAYQHFLNLWKDADADIPVLRQAKAEYAKLR
ncbi:MAG TPA: protein kinase [Bryobacteraceae bacterium]|jgi:tetratricopeptide (TPR) repeat protein